MDDELYEAAIAYYNNGSTEEQNRAKKFFHTMDVDVSGRVSLKEFSDIFPETGEELFQKVDRNGDGYLDFHEVLALYYLFRTRTVACDTCSTPLIGLHFTCVECFETPSGDTFDLCIKCYKEKTYSHKHSVFLDSYVILRAKRAPKSIWSTALRAMDVAFTVGSVGSAVAGCTIM